MSDLFSDQTLSTTEAIAPGAVILRGFVLPFAVDTLNAIEQVAAESPFRHLTTRGGYTMSVAMTNCGPLGWVSDRRGYRYDPIDPLTGRAWPAMPEVIRRLADRTAAEAGYANFKPDACLVNRYEPGSKLSMHQDHDEGDLTAPIVSISLGLPAIFLWGGETRKIRPRRIRLEHGDAVVWGGPSRLFYHGVSSLPDGEHPITGRVRFNLTFRKAV